MLFRYGDRVNKHNIEDLRMRVRNGPMKYPGANFLKTKKDTNEQYLKVRRVLLTCVVPRTVMPRKLGCVRRVCQALALDRVSRMLNRAPISRMFINCCANALLKVLIQLPCD